MALLLHEPLSQEGFQEYVTHGETYNDGRVRFLVPFKLEELVGLGSLESMAALANSKIVDGVSLTDHKYEVIFAANKTIWIEVNAKAEK